MATILCKFFSRLLKCQCASVAPEDLYDGLANPEVMLELSTTDKYDDVTFLLYDTLTDKRCHFKFDSKNFDREKFGFDGHVTHVARHGGRVIFVNFKSRYLLTLRESTFIEKIPGDMR